MGYFLFIHFKIKYRYFIIWLKIHIIVKIKHINNEYHINYQIVS